jgi:hypothetical protein
MTFKRSFVAESPAGGERRSGLNRRWIKGPYDGVDRRSGRDRRMELASGLPLEAGVLGEPGEREIENFLLSTAVRLEALVRVLQRKGLVLSEELEEEVRAIQADLDRRPPAGAE